MSDITQTTSSHPYPTSIKNGIELITVSAEDIGTHAEHWEALTPQPEVDVANWLGDMLDSAILPAGLHQAGEHLPTTHMLLATQDDVHPCQIITLNAAQKPEQLLTTFPSVNSPYHVTASIERMIVNPEHKAAVLRLKLVDETVLYAFDAFYAVNADKYTADQHYTAYLSGIAHQVEKITADETMTVTDPEAIRHHRALNAILAEHDGHTPDDLQERLAAWQPTSDTDTLPVTLDMSTMCAYLYGEQIGQEDEAWCQGEVLGLQNVTILSQPLYLLDIAVLREENTQPVVVRVTAHHNHTPENLQVGDFIRTNVWLQVKIHANNMNNS